MYQRSRARGCGAVGRGSRAINLFMGNVSFQIDSSFQNGEKYLFGEEDVSPSILNDVKRAKMG